MEKLVIKQIENIDDALDIAMVRNSGAEFMTHDVHRIDPLEQIAWFNEIYGPEHESGNMTAYIGHMALQAVAYGMIARKNGEYWVTGILSPETRGRGFGRALFEHLEHEIAIIPADKVMLDVRSDNAPARHLYEKLGYGYLKINHDPEVLIMQKNIAR